MVKGEIYLTQKTNSDRIYNCHRNKEVLLMSYSEQQAFDACADEPSTIFTFIKTGEFEVVEKLLDNNVVSVNTTDGVGNDVLTRLLKSKQYD